jgi:flagellar basal body-associated protein FliL
MVFKYLDTLRKKPEPERRKAVLWISIWVTLAIAIVWGIMISMRISSSDLSFHINAIPGDNTPSLADTFSNFFKQVEKMTTNSTSTTP